MVGQTRAKVKLAAGRGCDSMCRSMPRAEHVAERISVQPAATERWRVQLHDRRFQSHPRAALRRLLQGSRWIVFSERDGRKGERIAFGERDPPETAGKAILRRPRRFSAGCIAGLHTLGRAPTLPP